VTEFAQLLFQGISLGATYALVALGFVVVYRASGVINFAQGAMLLLGAYAISWLAVDAGLGFLLAVLCAAVLLALAGAGLHAVVLRRVTGQPAFVLVMITIGIGIAVTQGVEAVFGPDRRLLGDPWGSSAVHAGGLTFSTVKLWGIGVTLVALAAFFAFDRYTRWGLAMQATAADEEATLSLCTRSRGRWPACWPRSAGCSSPASPERRSRRSATPRCARSRRSCSAGSARRPEPSSAAC
jgi:branched-chain amino acid transport system permease protein